MASPRLDLREKLALTLTTAGSQRKLADSMGISPRALGRYLKGERDVPRELTTSVNLVFKIHRDIAIQQARALGIPMDSKRPVFVERPPVTVERRSFKLDKKGTLIPTVTRERIPGQRLIVENTEFISSKVRGALVGDILASPAVGAVTARTVGTAAQAVRQRVSGFVQFKQQLDERRLKPTSRVASYTEYSGKLTFDDAPGAVKDLQAKILKNNLPVDSLVFALPKVSEDIPKRKRARRAPVRGGRGGK